jgi:type I restriction enzyme M protein
MAPSTKKELQATLWKAAEKLRGSLSAGQYKDVILGLVFLKYVSDTHDGGTFAVPPSTRWKFLADNATAANIGRLIDEAMGTLMTANPTLAGTLPRLYESLDQRRLGELVHLLGGARFSR